MNIKADITIIIALIVILAGILYFKGGDEPATPIPEKPTATSTTGGGNSNGTETEAKDATITAKVNAPASAIGVSIAPLEIIEDSRCPSDVVCIQAGTVRVRVKITDPNGERVLIAVLNTPIPSAYATITLTEVEPEARAEIPIRTNEYRLKFEIKKQ